MTWEQSQQLLEKWQDVEEMADVIIMLELSTALWLSAVFGYGGYRFAVRRELYGIHGDFRKARSSGEVSELLFAAGLSILLVLGVVITDAWLQVVI